MAQPNDFEEESGRATRARTRLVVEGYSNLALIAILFTGVQVQLISLTDDPDHPDNSPLGIATSAVFYGGLVLSVFTAVLAISSGRWFSILREDDSDYLSSRWLAQDCEDLEKGKRKVKKSRKAKGSSSGGSRGIKKDKRKPDLNEYLQYQISSWKGKLAIEQLEPRRDSKIQDSPLNSGAPSRTGPGEGSGGQSPAEQSDQEKFISPNVFDIRCILKMLESEQDEQNDVESGANSTNWTEEDPGSRPWIRGRVQAIKGWIQAIGEWCHAPDKWLRLRESVLSRVLLSPPVVACAALALFCTGILMLVWNKRPRSVAVFTTVTVFVCVLLLLGFFVRHRRKHVIRKLYMGRVSF